MLSPVYTGVYSSCVNSQRRKRFEKSFANETMKKTTQRRRSSNAHDWRSFCDRYHQVLVAVLTPVLLIRVMRKMMPDVQLLAVLLLPVRMLVLLLLLLLLVKLAVKVLALLLMVLAVVARPVHAVVAGAAAPAPAAAPCHGRWPETAGCRDGSANAELPADSLDSNNVPAGTLARTAVHILSEDTNVRHAAWAAPSNPAEVGFPLAVYHMVFENDLGPREPFTPDDQVSERSVNFVPRRFVQPLITAFPLRLLYPIPRSSARALARATARFWPPERALLTRERPDPWPFPSRPGFRQG